MGTRIDRASLSMRSTILILSAVSLFLFGCDDDCSCELIYHYPDALDVFIPTADYGTHRVEPDAKVHVSDSDARVIDSKSDSSSPKDAGVAVDVIEDVAKFPDDDGATETDISVRVVDAEPALPDVWIPPIVPADEFSRIPLRIVFSGESDGRVPLTAGIPLPLNVGALEKLVLVDNDNNPLPTQIREQSVSDYRWILLDSQVTIGGEYALIQAESVDEVPRPNPAVTVARADDGGVVVDTGYARYDIPFTTALFREVNVGGQNFSVIEGASWSGEVRPLNPETDSIEIVESGPVRAMIRVRARNAVCGADRQIYVRADGGNVLAGAPDDKTCLDLIARMHFYAGMPYTRVRLTLANLNPCQTNRRGSHPDCNTLDSPDTVVFGDVSWRLDISEEVPMSNEILYQDSAGSEHWDYIRNIVHNPIDELMDENMRMQRHVHYRGYRKIVDGAFDRPAAAGDWADGTLQQPALRIDVPYFAENFPKMLQAVAQRPEGQQMRVGLFPGEWVADEGLQPAALHRLRPGEQKTMDVWLGLDPRTPAPWNLFAFPTIDALGTALSYIGKRIEGRFSEYDTYLDRQFWPEDDGEYQTSACQVRGTDTELARCTLEESIASYGHYGWLNYGDMPTDFESGSYAYNVKYDVNTGFVQHCIRNEHPQYCHWARISNLHFADIDVIHDRIRGYDSGRQWWTGGTCGHANHLAWALSNPHRDFFDPAPDLTYGITGMAAWSLMTGDDMVKEACLEVTDNLIYRMWNSGSAGGPGEPDECIYTAWRESAPFGEWGNGYGISVHQDLIPGLGPVNTRAVANVVRALTWAYKLTGDLNYLDGAAGGGRFYDCYREAIRPCPTWPNGLLGRALGEYIVTSLRAGIEPEPTALPSFMDNNESMVVQSIQVGHLMYMVPECVEEPLAYFEHTLMRNNWSLAVADSFAMAYALTGNRIWLDEYGLMTFNTGQEDPSHIEDALHYHSTKETVNAFGSGTIFLHFAHEAIDSGRWPDDRNGLD